MSIQVKICGLSTPETLDAALKGGASHVGFVFFAKSPRNLTAEKAAALGAGIANRAQTVGLFVVPTPDDIMRIRAMVRLNVIQLHGSETPADVACIRAASGLEVWKAIPVRTASDLNSAAPRYGAAELRSDAVRIGTAFQTSSPLAARMRATSAGVSLPCN